MIKIAFVQGNRNSPVMKRHCRQQRRNPQISDPLSQHGCGNLRIRRADIILKPANIITACCLIMQLAQGNRTDAAYRRFTKPYAVIRRQLLP
ncbi:hypothetical protein D3C81_1899460 [compost metagenome]